MKILLLDIETSPLTAYTWGLWNQNISIKAIVDSGSVLCWAAKWLYDDKVMFNSIVKHGKEKMLNNIHKLLDQADCVVHYNGSRFDIPTLNKEFIESAMTPPAPYMQVDLLKVARRQFKFPSNKLDYVGKALGVGSKTEHEGFDLWIKCMNRDRKAWKRMEAYNKQDVLLLEQVYRSFLPWVSNHANYGVVHNKPHCCPNCGSSALQKRGYRYTNSTKYQRYQCTDCGAWSGARYSEKIDKDVLK